MTIQETLIELIADGQIDVAISNFRNIKGLNNRLRNNLINFSARYNSIKRDKHSGVVDLEYHRLELAKITDALLAQIDYLSDIEIQPEEINEKVTILIAGTGRDSLSLEQIWMCKELGEMIGKEKYSLVTGGWKGVDKYVADAFGKQIIEKHNLSLSKYLTQIVPEGKDPGFLGGNVFQIKPGIMEWIKCLNLADIVILIGGINRKNGDIGGTYKTFKFAIQERIPVFPIAGSKQDCVKIFHESIKNWDERLYLGINKMQFIDVLNQDIKTEIDAIKIAEGINLMIKNFLKERRKNQAHNKA